MPIPPIVQRYLADMGVPFSVLAGGAAIPPAARVRAVVLVDDGEPLLAVFPADHELDVARLNEHLKRHLRPAGSDLVRLTFPDCDASTPTALGSAYGVRVFVDPAVDSMPLITFDSGGAGTMLRVSRQAFWRLQPHAHRDLRFAVRLSPVVGEALLGLPRLDIKSRLVLPNTLPAAPATAQRLLGLRSDPHAGVRELCEVIRADPGIAAQVLRYANCALHAARGRSDSLERAIVVVGFEVVLTLALGSALMGTLRVPLRLHPALGDLWRRAVYAASTCESLARAVPAGLGVGTGAAYLAGLLQDVGYLVVAQRFAREFLQWRRTVQLHPELDESALETHMLGMTHTQIGASLLRAWGLPEEIVAGVEHHDTPWYSGAHALYPQLVLVANRALARHGLSAERSDALPAGSLLALSLEEGTVRRTVERLLEAQEDLNDLARALAA